MKTELKNIGAWGRMHYDFFTGAIEQSPMLCG